MSDDDLDDADVYRPPHIPEDVWAAALDVWQCDRQPQERVGQQRLHITCRAIIAERERCIRATVATANEGGDAGTCLSIAEEIRCPDIETKRAAIRLSTPSVRGDAR